MHLSTITRKVEDTMSSTALPEIAASSKAKRVIAQAMVVVFSAWAAVEVLAGSFGGVVAAAGFGLPGAFYLLVIRRGRAHHRAPRKISAVEWATVLVASLLLVVMGGLITGPPHHAQTSVVLDHSVV